MINWSLVTFGFSMGTFKFLFAHWLTYYAMAEPTFFDLLQIFISTTAGAWITLTVFYWMSDYFMKRAKIRRLSKNKASKKNESKNWFNNSFRPKIKKIRSLFRIKAVRNFRRWLYWRIKRFIVKVKNGLGVYGITLLAPLFLSIPGGAIVCAKFFGSQKKTFPLMLLNTGIYSFLMCLWIYTTQ